MRFFPVFPRYAFVLFLATFLGTFPDPCRAETFSATTLPWSGYWWPLNEGGLLTGQGYHGPPSPLNRYDLYTTGTEEGPVTRWYRDRIYRPDALYWEGHCLAWAKAAMTEPSPILPSSENNIIFRTGDKKGLLTMAHNNDLLVRAAATATNFHFWLLSYIKDRKLPFIADLDPSEEKWFYPIYKYDMQSSIQGNIESVQVRIYYATDTVPPDFYGTKTVWATYSYDLVLGDQGEITDGYWTGDSITEHPDVLYFPLQRQSSIPYLDDATVQDLATSKDDFLENGSAPSDLSPGNYNLVLLDQDRYRLKVLPGDSFTLRVTKLFGSTSPLEIDFAPGLPVSRHFSLSSNNEETVIRIDQATHSSYDLILHQDDYSSPNLYNIRYDLRRWFTKRIPYLQRTNNWIGFALSNGTTRPIEDITLTSYNSSGQPVHSLLGPFNLAPGEKQVFLFDDLPYRLHELRDTKGLLLTANDRVDFSALLGKGMQRLISENQEELPSSRMVLPETFTTNTANQLFTAIISNETLQDNSVRITAYRNDGTVQGSSNHTLPEHGRLELRPGSNNLPQLAEDGWLEIESLQQRPLTAFEYFVKEGGNDGVFGLPSNREIKYIPHIARPFPWQTTLTLYNGANTSNTIRLNPIGGGFDPVEMVLLPREKRELDLAATIVPSPSKKRPIVAVSAEHNFAGMVCYRNQVTGERASLPLHNSNNLGKLLVMPHYPNPDYWWCGIGVFTAEPHPVTVIATPFSVTGQILSDAQVRFTLAPGSYQVFTVASLFSPGIGQLSHISFTSENSAELIGGFYLYGAKNGAAALSGAKM